MAQLVKRPTLDFGSGQDLKVVGSSPTLGSTLSGESAYDSISLTLPVLTTDFMSIKTQAF